MAKFRVIVVEQCSYMIDVEADGKEQARDRAITVMENTVIRMERDATTVYENPPNWQESR
jgi:predicted RNA methylase